MNLGIDIAKGEYLGIVETDDFISSEMYEELYTIAKEKKLDFIKADFYRFTVSPNGIIRNYNKLSKNEKYYNRILKPSEELKTFYFPMNTWSGIYSLDFIRRNKIDIMKRLEHHIR